jgi:hypothetical protein
VFRLFRWNNRSSSLEQSLLYLGTIDCHARNNTGEVKNARGGKNSGDTQTLSAKDSTAVDEPRRSKKMFHRPHEAEMEQEDEAVVGGLVCSMGRTESMP